MASTQCYFSENYAWVDQRLETLYYGYALTTDNCDEFQDAGLLTENWAWVDDLLRKKFCDEYYEDGSDDEREFLLCPAPLSWVDYRERCVHTPLEEVLGKRKRSASDKYDYVEDCDDVSSLGCDVEQESQEADKEYVSIQFLEQSIGSESESSYEDYCDSP